MIIVTHDHHHHHHSLHPPLTSLQTAWLLQVRWPLLTLTSNYSLLLLPDCRSRDLPHAGSNFFSMLFYNNSMRCCPPLCRQSVTLLLGLEKIFVNIVNFNFPVTGRWSPAPVSACTLTLTTDSSRTVNEKRTLSKFHSALGPSPW